MPSTENDIERRFIFDQDIELLFRSVHDDDDDKKKKPKFRGHSAMFNKLSLPMFGFREKIAPGAFSKTIEKDDIRSLINHDPSQVLGRNTAGTLRLHEDSKGLVFEVDSPDTSFARDLEVSVDRGDINQSSFGFRVLKESWEFVESGPDIRTLEEVELFDVSILTFPAYPQTSAQVRQRMERVQKGEDSTVVSDEAIAKAKASKLEPVKSVDIMRRRLRLRELDYRMEG